MVQEGAGPRSAAEGGRPPASFRSGSERPEERMAVRRQVLLSQAPRIAELAERLRGTAHGRWTWEVRPDPGGAAALLVSGGVPGRSPSGEPAAAGDRLQLPG